MRLKTWAALAAALTLPLLNGCGDDNANKGWVRNVNATSEYTSLDLYDEDSSSDTNKLVSATAANAASGYAGLDKGSYTFEPKSSSAASYAASVTGTVTKGDHYAVVTYVTGGAVKATYLDENEDKPSSGVAKVRIFNAASGEASSVDVYLSTNDCSALTSTDSAFASAVTGLQDSYTQVTTGSGGATWNVCVFTAGDTDTSSLLLSIPSVTFSSKEIATLILTHTDGGVLLNGAVLQQQGDMTAYTGTLARVRVVADAASTGAVSLTLGDTSLAALATSPQVLDYQTVTAGTLDATVTIDGTATSGLSETLAAGNDYTLLVTGSAGAPVVTLITDDNSPSTSSTKTVKARVINGLNNGSGTVTVTVDSKSIGAPALNAASSYTQIAATSGTSTVTPSITTTPSTLVNQTFSADGVYTVFIWGDASAPKMSLYQDR